MLTIFKLRCQISFCSYSPILFFICQKINILVNLLNIKIVKPFGYIQIQFGFCAKWNNQLVKLIDNDYTISCKYLIWHLIVRSGNAVSSSLSDENSINRVKTLYTSDVFETISLVNIIYTCTINSLYTCCYYAMIMKI